MLVGYSIFCIGCGFLQTAASKTPSLDPGANPLNAPLWFLTPAARFVIGGIGILSIILEIIIGFVFIAWWAAIFFWLIAYLLAQLILLRSENPAPPFFIGILITVIGVVLISVMEA